MSLIHVAGLDLDMDETAFRRWYEREHVPSVLNRPGWLGARCYSGLRGEPHLLTIYDLNDALRSSPDPISAAPFSAGVVERRGVRNYHARTYQEIYEAGEHRDTPGLINVVTVDIEGPHAESFSRWYNEVHFPEILACPGWKGGRRYECVDGQPRFLAIYDLEDAERPFNTPEYEAAVGWDAFAGHIRGYHGFRIYERIWDSYAI